MKQVLDAIEKRQEELREMCLKVTEAPHLSEDCKTFVKTIPYIVAGNTWWHHHVGLNPSTPALLLADALPLAGKVYEICRGSRGDCALEYGRVAMSLSIHF